VSAPVAASRRPVVGLDVGGTSMKGLLVLLPDGAGTPEVIALARNATPVSDGVDAVVAAMHDTITELVDAAARHGLPVPDRAGVVVPGIVDEVEGIGPARKKALLKRFGSVRRIREASVDELAETPGIPREVAERLKGHLAREGMLA